MSDMDLGLFTVHDYFEKPRDYTADLEMAIEQYKRFPDGYEHKYFGNLVAEALMKLRESQKTIGA